MCGRFALNTTEDELRAQFLVKNSFVFKAKYNISPGQIIPAFILNKLGQTELVFMQWGFVPSWKKETNSKGYSNARLETVLEKPTFKQAFLKNRCLIPATGYYEWQVIHQRKQPFFIYLKNQPLFAMAGIWAPASEASLLPTCAILTEEAEKESEMAKIHERMPVIVPPLGYTNWLNTQIKKEAVILDELLPKETALCYFPVSIQVNSPQFDHPDCLRALS
jgi:putative SOS response-associated peptidase YedK